MKIINFGGWVFYVSEEAKNLDKHKCGKWMYFFDDEEFVAKICKDAVELGIVAESKHSDDATGGTCKVGGGSPGNNWKFGKWEI